jgi:hypothetical protein
VSLRLRIDEVDETLGEEQLSLSSADMNTLAITVAGRLVAMVGQIPLKGADQ